MEQEKNNYKCPLCELKFKNTKLLSQHVKRKHDTRLKEFSRINSEKEFIDFVDKLNNYELVEENFCYKNAHQKVKLKHLKCGKIWKPKIYKFWKEGSRCPNNSCFQQKRVSHLRKNNVFDDFFSSGKYKIVQENYTYKSKRDRVKVRHDCGYEWEPILDNLFRGKTVCPKCKHKPRQEETIKRLFRTLDGEKDYILVNRKSFKYTNSKQKINIRHTKCGKSFNPTIHNFLDNQSRCPNCVNNISQAEKEIRDFVKSIGVDIKEKNCNIRSVIPPKELDIYIPERNFAIEYNGLYWHSEERVGKKAHIDKTLACYKKDIKLFHIFSDEWRDKQEIIKSMIASRLGKSQYRIYARHCEVREVENKREAKEFLQRSHVSGDNNAKVYFGLFYDNKLISVLSLKKPIQKKYGNAIEIARFSSELNYSVVGGFSKILKVVKKWAVNKGFDKIVTYSDRRFGFGKVYEKCGFKKVEKDTGIDYWYSNGLIRETRFKYRANNGKTEKQVAEENNVFRIYGCGSSIYMTHL